MTNSAKWPANLIFSVQLGILPVIGRTDTYMLLEIFREERLVGEMQFFGDFLDAFRRVLEQHTDFQYHIVVNLPIDASLGAEMLAQQSDELGKDDVVASHRLRLLLFYAPDDIAHVVEHSQ